MGDGKSKSSATIILKVYFAGLAQIAATSQKHGLVKHRSSMRVRIRVNSLLK